MADERRRNVILGFTIAELIAAITFTVGGSYAIFKIEATANETKTQVKEIKRVHQSDMEQMRRALNETELRLRAEAKQNKIEIREDIKDLSHDIKTMLRSMGGKQ